MKLWFQYWTDFDEATWGWRASLRHPNASIQCIDPQREWSAKHPTVLRNTTLMAREQRFRCAVLRNTPLMARERGNRPAVLRKPLPVVLDHQKSPHVLRNTLLVTRRGAGAKKCWGPAPQYNNNILKVRNLSFSNGAGHHEKFAPAPSGDQISSR